MYTTTHTDSEKRGDGGGEGRQEGQTGGEEAVTMVTDVRIRQEKERPLQFETR